MITENDSDRLDTSVM